MVGFYNTSHASVALCLMIHLCGNACVLMLLAECMCFMNVCLSLCHLASFAPCISGFVSRMFSAVKPRRIPSWKHLLVVLAFAHFIPPVLWGNFFLWNCLYKFLNHPICPQIIIVNHSRCAGNVQGFCPWSRNHIIKKRRNTGFVIVRQTCIA